MKYTNGTFTGTYNQCREHINASIPREHPENWPDGPWTVVELEPVIYVPDLKTVKEQAQAELVYIFEKRAEEIAGKYPWFERDTWQQQETEALAYQADPNTPMPLLTGIATQRGITVAELAQRVIANAAAWRAVAPDLCGQRQAASDQIENAETAEAVWQLMESLRNPPAES
ncbi:hypothetical protein CFI10_11135 [Marinobacterium iners]|uniref:hypothetical protein n=1 Tax=Marinobacterium iners TaxID=48076 RepID=UPI001A9000E7|nr:hypothetical protein [Marinobacterium iners]QSR35541.1 hypothetical protein CFI10_11135 [Marinobacterium iners]